MLCLGATCSQFEMEHASALLERTARCPMWAPANRKLRAGSCGGQRRSSVCANCDWPSVAIASLRQLRFAHCRTQATEERRALAGRTRACGGPGRFGIDAALAGGGRQGCAQGNLLAVTPRQSMRHVAKPGGAPRPRLRDHSADPATRFPLTAAHGKGPKMFSVSGSPASTLAAAQDTHMHITSHSAWGAGTRFTTRKEAHGARSHVCWSAGRATALHKSSAILASTELWPLSCCCIAGGFADTGRAQHGVVGSLLCS